ncbi:hypothetical protein RJ641_030991 [Dillenia turbinata]|uniref:Fe2OG dioxygenase domain-containing protein n=1 Tax=Dillenia turbinata TaxID=194707 RepID=A0AAN8W066_9MAGN
MPTAAEAESPVVAPMTAAVADSIIGWFRGEFAAANAIIDALCGHIAQLESISSGGGSSEYESVFAAIHRRRLNWIPVIQMQKYCSIADVVVELRKVAARKKMNGEEGRNVAVEDGAGVCDEKEKKVDENSESNLIESHENVSSNGGSGGSEVIDEESPDSEITDGGSQEVHPSSEVREICSHHEDCEARRAQIKLTKGFVAKEPVNVVKGLKLFEDIFHETELSKLKDFINELRVAGQNGELSGESYILFNKQIKGNKRELIQLGAPIFGQIKEEATSNIEPIPPLLQAVIDHLVQWHLIPVSRKPNSCIINFFDEGEYSQPYLKPPHLEQPISTLLLAESNMAFGRTLVSDNEGNFKGPLMLSLKEGSLLVMRQNSADMARHVMCQSANKRISITFFQVRQDTHVQSPGVTPLTSAMTLWQPVPSAYAIPNGTLKGYEPLEVIPKWGVISSPMVMVAPVRPMVLSPRRLPNGGTGVFLPWTVGSRRPARHLPPRAQKGRFLALPAPSVPEPTHDPALTVEAA